MNENPISENPTLKPFITPKKEQKFCKDCANLIGNRDNPENSILWKCGAEENRLQKTLNLLTGEIIVSYRVEFCKDQRTTIESLPRCGIEGKWFIEYKRPVFLEPEEPRSFSTRKRVTEDDLKHL